MSKFKVGDRVKYIGDFSPEWVGKVGVVKRDPTSPNSVTVLWDGDRDDSDNLSFPMPVNLELIEPTIDVTEPLEYLSGSNTAKAPLVGVTVEGNIITGRNTTSDNIATAIDWVMFDREGKFVRSGNGQGSGLKLRNAAKPAPVIHKKQLYLVGDDVRMTNSSTDANISVTVEDGKIIAIDVL